MEVDIRTVDTVDIRTVDTVGTWAPKFFAATPNKGQANFVYLRLQEKEVRAVNYHGEVGIYSRHKLPVLIETVQESEQYLEKEHLPIQSDCLKIQKGQELICVVLEKGNKVYVTEEKMQKLQFYIFMKELPIPKEYKIFATKKEMAKALEEKENFLI